MNQETCRTGLVSVTFRALPPEQIVELVAKAKLDGIEWGGDVHVPHGDLARARAVRAMTLDAGIGIPAYGSYYRAAVSEAEGLPFERVLETAVQLAAATIRVWAGDKGSDQATAADRRAVADDLHRICDLATAAGRTVSLEYHGGTLTDTTESAHTLLNAVPHPALLTLWQPPNNRPLEHCVASLRSVLDCLGNVHVFHWENADNSRHPLAEGEPRWCQYLRMLRKHGGSRYFLLEFVKGDSPEQFLEDAATLRGWLGNAP